MVDWASLIHAHVINLYVKYIVTKTVNGVHYIESKQAGFFPSFTSQKCKLLMGNLPNFFFAKHLHYMAIMLKAIYSTSPDSEILLDALSLKPLTISYLVY